MARCRLSMIAGGLLAATAASGCAYESADCSEAGCEEPLGESAEPAFSPGNVLEPWPTPGGQMSICLTNDGTLTDSEFTTATTYVVSKLNNTWGNVPGLDFVANCGGGSLPVKVSKGNGGWGQCSGYGVGASCEFLFDPVNPATADVTLVHEVGHGMAMHHEHQRYGVTLCPREQQWMDDCIKCSDEADPANEVCSVAEFTGCLGAPKAADVIVLSANDRAAATSMGTPACQTCATGTCFVGSCATAPCTPSNSYWSCFGRAPTDGAIKPSAEGRWNAFVVVENRKFIPEGLELTLYDPLSVMNYCAVYNGGPGDAVPTALDLLGMEMMYPADRVYRLGCGVGCFMTGEGLLVSSSGRIVSEWISRGSLSVPFQVEGANIYSYPVTSLPSGTSTVNYTFRTPGGKIRNGSGLVTKLDMVFAAITQAATDTL